MARAFAIRRAAAYRQRAQQLSQIAAYERREDVRRHILDQAATFSARRRCDGATAATVVLGNFPPAAK
jgi:hypothetical protein